MIVTDKFVFIHKPKTGGTFVTNALMELYEVKWNFLHAVKRSIFHEVNLKGKFGDFIITGEKHAGCNKIPDKYRDRDVLSTIRNPFDYYVSEYEFGWWKRKEWLKYYRKEKDFETKFSNFPDLSFHQYLQLMARTFNDDENKDFDDPDALGYYSVDFIRHHFYNPEAVLNKIDDPDFEQNNYEKEMYPLHFLFTHKLNKQLYLFLLAKGYPQESVNFILSKEKVLPLGKGRTEDQKWQHYYTPELKELVRKKDRFIFQMFPEIEMATVS